MHKYTSYCLHLRKPHISPKVLIPPKCRESPTFPKVGLFGFLFLYFRQLTPELTPTPFLASSFCSQKLEKHRISVEIRCFLWLRRQDSNLRPPGYEPDELPTALLRDIRCTLECLGILTHETAFVNSFSHFSFDLIPLSLQITPTLPAASEVPVSRFWMHSFC